jgi:hypothetical protein
MLWGDEEDERCCKWVTGGVLLVAGIPDSDKEMSGPPPCYIQTPDDLLPNIGAADCLFTGCLEDLACTWKWNNNKWQEHSRKWKRAKLKTRRK